MERNENNPRVRRFKGRASKFNTGFNKTSKSVKATPPNKKVNNPPVTFTPGKLWDRKKIEKALKRQFLKKGFMYTVKMLAKIYKLVN